MIYVISKATFGSYDVRDIQCNANWDCCPYSDYALIPDSMVEGILATKGYCDITLNDAGTEVASYTARSIPSVPEECCGINTVLSVNGVGANGDGEVMLTPDNIGAVSIATHHYYGGAFDADVAAWLDEILATMPNHSAVTVSGTFFNYSHVAYGILYKNTNDWASLYTTSYVDEEWRRFKCDGVWEPSECITRATKADVDSLSTDYIIAQGTSGIWTYRKWASGIAECWTSSFNFDGLGVSAGGSNKTTLAFPFNFYAGFDTTKHISISRSLGREITANFGIFFNHYCEVYVNNFGTSDVDMVTLDISISGRWK